MACVMNDVQLKDARTDVNPETFCKVQVLNSREYSAKQSIPRSHYGTKRSELLILNKRTGGCVTRKTLWRWDCILQAHPKMKDYRRDSYTQCSLWDKGQEWSPHQVWCLEKVAEFMQTKSIYRNTATKHTKNKIETVVVSKYRYPTYEELNHYLTTSYHRLTFKQFMEEIKEKYNVN